MFAAHRAALMANVVAWVVAGGEIKSNSAASVVVKSV
jgi:hypothetical protein